MTTTHSKGRFLVVEGLEGAGKSSAVQCMVEYLTEHHIPFVQTREPGGTQIAEQLRTLIKSGLNDEVLCAQSELLLIYAARVQLVEQVIRPALNAGTWVICDRFELSTYAYQGGGRQLDTNIIDTLSSFCLRGLKPDRLFFLDIMPEQGLSRVKLRGASDNIERESLAFFSRVYHMYHERLALMSGVCCIDASQPMDTVMSSVKQELDVLVNSANPFDARIPPLPR
ncbi:MAG: dTMP kinase [Gammaproteobacteria bacterium]|nr:dTMP kinase [Gammaproteobacteria bacterium]